MYLRNKLYYIGVFCSLLLTLVACNDQVEGWTPAGETEAVVKATLSDYRVDGNISSLNGESQIDDMQACLFENGVLTEVYQNLTKTGDGYALKVKQLSGKLYILANTGSLLDLNRLKEEGITEKEWKNTVVTTQEGKAVGYATGEIDLGQQPAGQTVIPMSLKRGVARFDLLVKTGGAFLVKRVTLKNLAQQAYLLPQDEPLSPDGSALQDLTFNFEQPLGKDSLGLAYVYEQASPDFVIQAEIEANGKTSILEADGPSALKRNAVYTLTVRKDQLNADLKLEVAEWEYAGEAGLYPDLDSRLTIDRTLSELPDGATLNEAGDELKLASPASTFVLAVGCDDELELVPFVNPSISVEKLPASEVQAGTNLFRVQKNLVPPGYPEEKVRIQFHRKGLQGTYEEDYVTLTLQENPITVSGMLHFDKTDYVCDFKRYVDNELGVWTLPEGMELIAKFDQEDPWMKVEQKADNSHAYRVLGGWKPNDPKADGRVQEGRLVVRRVSDGAEMETYIVKRRNYGLPVTLMNGVWWCKYNSMGNSRDFEDQILVPDDPAAKAGKTVLEYLNECSPAEYLQLWKWSYIGADSIGMEVVDDGGSAKLKGYRNPSVNTSQLDPKALAPDGYELPPVEYYDRIFRDWWMYLDRDGGPHRVWSPWENKNDVFVTSGNRTDLQLGTVALPKIIHCEIYNKKGGVKDESVTFYGPGAQWNNNGLNHNKVVFGCYSLSDTGWFNRYDAYGLHRQYIGKENSRILRFIKSPVEYIYGIE